MNILMRTERVFPSETGAQQGLDQPRYGAHIALSVDVRDVSRGILQVRETMDVHPGRLTVLYPEWLPGYHAPEAPIELLAGLHFCCNGVSVPWRRDPINVHAFHLEIPLGCEELQIEYQMLCATAKSQGRIGVTLEQINLQWNSVILYPAGMKSKEIAVDASVHLPSGWKYACGLKQMSFENSKAEFHRVALDRLVDTPLFAGKYCQSYALDNTNSIRLNVFGDRDEQTKVGESQLQLFKNLIAEADKLFGARHFRHFDFLLAVSDELGALGVEHQESAEIVMPPNFFTEWDKTVSRNDVIAHEYVHSWNGKYRRGRDSWTASFDEPIRSSLLWVYEGLTQYYGQVLAVRAGLWDNHTFQGALARTAAQCELMKGRSWRPLFDTTRDPVIAARQSLPWASWQRSEDYYSDGQLLWLEVDTIIRERTRENHSLDDFAQSFFGMNDGDIETSPYDVEEVVRCLHDICPFQWMEFFEERLNQVTDAPPLEGLTRAGYSLQFADDPNVFQKANDDLLEMFDARFGLGFSVKSDGLVAEVVWDSPAFHAGLTAGATILAIDGHAFSHAQLKLACSASNHNRKLSLAVKRLKHHISVEMPTAPLRYPVLARNEAVRDRLAEILTSRR